MKNLVILCALACLVGCSDPAVMRGDAAYVPDGAVDVPVVEVDAGMPDTGVDAGTAHTDSGMPMVDSGTPVVDSGTPVVDAGTDSGTTGMDAGVTADAGVGSDAGTVSPNCTIEIVGYTVPQYRRRVVGGVPSAAWQLHDPGTGALLKQNPEVFVGSAWVAGSNYENDLLTRTSATAIWTVNYGSNGIACNLLQQQASLGVSDFDGDGDEPGMTNPSSAELISAAPAGWMTVAAFQDSYANGTVQTSSWTPVVMGWSMTGDLVGASIVAAPIVVQWRVVVLP